MDLPELFPDLSLLVILIIRLVLLALSFLSLRGLIIAEIGRGSPQEFAPFDIAQGERIRIPDAETKKQDAGYMIEGFKIQNNLDRPFD